MKISLLILTLLLSNFSFAQNETLLKDVKEALQLAKETSLYRDTVDWDILEKEVMLKAKTATSYLELKPAFDHLLAELKDHHGIYIYDNNNLVGNYDNPDEVAIERTPSFIKNVKFIAKTLDKTTGYIRLKHLPMGDNIAMSKVIRNKVDSLLNNGVTQWVVDLRYNMGGNMYPMLEGLAPILGNGELGGTINKDGVLDSKWTIKIGHFYFNDTKMVALEKVDSATNNYKVAVLISHHTASSGEVVATAFHGRKNTRFFGQHTRGMITNNSWVPISEKLISNIATGYFTDRNGVIFKKHIYPDDIVIFVVESDVSKDNAIIKAKRWLNQ